MAEELEDISGVGPSKADALRAAGYETVEDVKAASQSELSQVDGVGNARSQRVSKPMSAGWEVDEEADAEIEDETDEEEEADEADTDEDVETELRPPRSRR